MTPKIKKMFMALVGAYLAYIGVNLVKSALASQPRFTNAFVVLGVLFAIFGLATIVFNIKGYLEECKSEKEQNEETEETAEAEEARPFEEPRRQPSGAVFAKVGEQNQTSRDESGSKAKEEAAAAEKETVDGAAKAAMGNSADEEASVSEEEEEGVQEEDADEEGVEPKEEDVEEGNPEEEDEDEEEEK